MEVQPVKNRDQLHKEFEIIRQLSPDGLLHAKAAVAWARNNPESALHAELEWDDTAAAESFREQQVRQIIRVIVVPSDATADKVRAYVSAPSDRENGGGYMPVGQALAKARGELINDALRKLMSFEKSYTHLPELTPVFNGIRSIINDYRHAKNVA